MNCKQIREAIDAASRHNSHSGYVASHLSACPDCHRYSDEAASLLKLLSAQPRVEAPPDFEFNLRARLQRAQAAPAIDSQGFLRKIRPWTFSWGQTVAAAAALTLVVTVSTLYINRDKVAPGADGVIANRIPDPQPNELEPTPKIKPPTDSTVGATPVKFTPRNVKARLAPFQSESASSPNGVGGVAGSAPVYTPDAKRLLKDRRVFYGAETASIIMAKPTGVALTF